MYLIYVLKSLKNGRKYVGYTHRAIDARLAEHNQGYNKWSRKNGPFKIIYTEKYNTEKEARNREKYFKTGKGREFLKKAIPA
jgi:putative endonuclease